jgi:hypothetical protein
VRLEKPGRTRRRGPEALRKIVESNRVKPLKSVHDLALVCIAGDPKIDIDDFLEMIGEGGLRPTR